MKKKIIGMLLITMLIFVGAGQATQISNTLEITNNDARIDVLEEDPDENLTLGKFIIGLVGPPLRFIVDLEDIEDGTGAEEFQRCISGRPPLKARLLPIYPVAMKGVDFTLYFKRDTKKTGRFAYTGISAQNVLNESGAIVNTTNEQLIISSVIRMKVENFTGVFSYHRGQIRAGFLHPNLKKWFVPPTFSLIGSADNITYPTLD